MNAANVTESGEVMKEGFEEAVGKFQDFLEMQGRPRQIVWVAREDIVFPGKPFFYVRKRDPNASDQFARQEYEIGAGKGLGVLLHAFCKVDRTMFCHVWSPADADEAERMMMPGDGGLKMSVRIENPVFAVKIVRNRLLWAILNLLYRRRGIRMPPWN